MNVRRFNPLIVAVMTVITLTHANLSRAAEIKVLCSNGIKTVMEELVPQFQQATKHTVVVTYGVSAVLKRQIEAGAPFDVAILTPSLIDELIKGGKVSGETRTVVARSGIALAIRAGASKPDIRTTDALKRTLLQAKSIAYAKEGASGPFFTDLVQRIGLADSLQSKLKSAANGEEIGTWVARGDAELGVLPISEILPIPRVEVLGTFPGDLQGYLVMAAGVGSKASQRSVAQELVKFLMAPAAVPVLKKKGMERVTPSGTLEAP